MLRIGVKSLSGQGSLRGLFISVKTQGGQVVINGRSARKFITALKNMILSPGERSRKRKERAYRSSMKAAKSLSYITVEICESYDSLRRPTVEKLNKLIDE